MNYSQFRDNKKTFRVLISCIILTIVSSTIIFATDLDSDCLTPTDDQYFELRAVSVSDVEGQNKQVIMELWGNNIEFKRI